MISDKSANVLVGPITFPNPGPTLARDVAAPDKEVKKSFPRKDRIKVYSEKYQNEKVQSYTLDHWLSKNNISNNIILKLDIEGAEKFALKGMINTLKITRNVCISCHDFLAEKYNDVFYRSKDIVKDFLIKNNYEIIEREHENPWTSDMIYN